MKNKFIVYGLLAGGTYLAYKHFTKKSKMDINDINVFVETRPPVKEVPIIEQEKKILKDINVFVETDEKEIQPPVKEVPIIEQEKKILKELVKDKVTIGKAVGMWSSRDAKSYMDRFQ